jgi:hypothetical protein
MAKQSASLAASLFSQMTTKTAVIMAQARKARQKGLEQDMLK